MIELRVSALLISQKSTRIRTTRHFVEVGNKRTTEQWIDAIIGSGIGETVIVVGEKTGIRDFKDLPVRFVVNRSTKEEPADSVRAGLRELGDSASGILLCDVNSTTASVKTIRTLALEHYAFCNKIIMPRERGKQGHPVLFPRKIISEILSRPSIETIISKDPRRIRLVDVPDEVLIPDAYMSRDYEDMLCRAGIRGTS